MSWKKRKFFQFSSISDSGFRRSSSCRERQEDEMQGRISGRMEYSFLFSSPSHRYICVPETHTRPSSRVPLHLTSGPRLSLALGSKMRGLVSSIHPFFSYGRAMLPSFEFSLFFSRCSLAPAALPLTASCGVPSSSLASLVPELACFPPHPLALLLPSDLSLALLSLSLSPCLSICVRVSAVSVCVCVCVACR